MSDDGLLAFQQAKPLSVAKKVVSHHPQEEERKTHQSLSLRLDHFRHEQAQDEACGRPDVKMSETKSIEETLKFIE